MPQKLLYPVTLFTIRANDAFKAGLLEEGVNYIRLEWNDEVLKGKKEDCSNFIQSDFAVLDIWNRVHFVAGSREKKRPYTLRVGAGGRLNGKSTSMAA